MMEQGVHILRNSLNGFPAAGEHSALDLLNILILLVSLLLVLGLLR